jgi:hypothetical protein
MATAAANPKLEVLLLAQCAELSDISLRAVAENCLSLHHLDVGFCSRITDEGISSIGLLGSTSI